MGDTLVANITALLGGVVPVLLLRLTYRNRLSDFRWISWVAAAILVAVGLQYLILVVPRLSARADTAEGSSELSELIDQIEYKMALAPLPDSAEFRASPSWGYYYNDGDSYVEGYSEVRLIRNMPAYQYKVRVRCSDPDVLYLAISEGYFGYSFATETSPRGSVTSVSVSIDNTNLLIADKVRVTDGFAIISASNLVDRLSKGVLLEFRISARVERFEWYRYHDAIFVLNLLGWSWRECFE